MTVRMEWALLSIQVRGLQENFTDPAPLEGSCNIDVLQFGQLCHVH